MAQQIYPFSNPAEYSFDTNKIEVVGGVAKLKVVPSADFTNNSTFTNGGDYTFDSNKVEFVGGKAKLKNQTPEGTRLYASFKTNLNGNYGVGSLVPAAGPTTSWSGVLEAVQITNATDYLRWLDNGKIVKIDGSNLTYRFRWLADYSGSPGGGIRYFVASADTFPTPGTYLKIYHHTTGTIRVDYVRASGDAVRTVTGPSFSPISGTNYEFEIHFNYITGSIDDHMEVYFWQDGNYLGMFQNSHPFQSISLFNISHHWLGNDYSQASARTGFFREFAIFNSAQHTFANYSPSPVVMPEFPHDIDGVSVSMNTNIFSETEPPGVYTITSIIANEVNPSGDFIKYNVSIDNGVTWLWWSGTSWDPSSGYSQSNVIADVHANRNSIGVPAGDKLRFRVWLKSNTGATSPEIDNIETKHKINTYDLTNPTILTNQPVVGIELTAFAEVAVKPSGDEIKYQLFKGGSTYYWNGSAWVVGSGYTQTNIAADINTNIAAFLSGPGGESVKVLAFLHTNSGTTTPELDTVTVDYTPDTVPPIITLRSPDSGESFVPVNTAIAVTFNEALDPTTAIGGNFFLMEGLNVVPMTGAPVLSNGNKTITITPAAPLLATTSYNVHLTAMITDVAGVAFTGEIYSFVTDVAPEPAPDKCLVYGQILDAGGQPLESIDVTAVPLNMAETDTGFTIIPNIAVAVTTSETGTWSIYLVRSSELNPDQQYKITFRKRDSFREFTVTIPDAGTVNFNTLI